MKTCSKCKIDQPVEAFPKSGGRGGLSAWCRGCHHSRYKEKKASSNAEAMSKATTDPISDIEREMKAKGISIRALADAVGVHEVNARLWFTREKAPRQGVLRRMYEAVSLALPLALKPGDGGRMPLAVKKCDACGADFPVYKAGVRFCSRECSGLDLSSRQLGAANAAWKGGVHATRPSGGGYIKQMSKGHPFADAGGYVMQHRLVMEAKLGRKLEAHERVHHKNGKRDDNRPENLELWTGVGTSKKDPHGIRMVDKVIDMIDSLSAEELQRIAEHIASKGQKA